MEGRGRRGLMLRMMLARRASSTGRDFEWLSFLGVLRVLVEKACYI